jgi:hypothetical protein
MVLVSDCVLVDITLRMLRPRELFRAQSFPESYIIDELPDPALLFKDGKQVADPLTVPRIPLTATAQACSLSVTYRTASRLSTLCMVSTRSAPTSPSAKSSTLASGTFGRAVLCRLILHLGAAIGI